MTVVVYTAIPMINQRYRNFILGMIKHRGLAFLIAACCVSVSACLLYTYYAADDYFWVYISVVAV